MNPQPTISRRKKGAQRASDADGRAPADNTSGSDMVSV
jgi:hypothetical protein